MPVVRVKGVANPMQFPDDMDINDIREFLRRRFMSQMGESQPDLAPIESVAQEVKPSLAERAGQGISNVLYDSGIISDRYGAQRIGSNLSSIGEFLPVIGDATAGDEFGRAAAQGDKTGMLLAGLGAIPIAGDFAKKGAKKTAKWYHGTNAEFTDFDNKFLGSANPATDSKFGFYFGRRPDTADAYREVTAKLNPDKYKSAYGRTVEEGEKRVATAESKFKSVFGMSYDEYNSLGYRGRREANESIDNIEAGAKQINNAKKELNPLTYEGYPHKYDDWIIEEKGGRTIEAELPTGNMKEVDFAGQSWDEAKQSREARQAIDEGFDGVIFKDMQDSGWFGGSGVDDIALVFDSKKIKQLNPSTNKAMSVGDAAKKAGKSFNPLDEFTSLIDKTAARREARLKIYNLPTKGAAESINDITDLFDYTPEQLVSQMKILDQTGIRKGGYLKKGDNINVFYSDDGTSQMINPKTSEVIFDNDIEQTTRLIKDDILTTANGKLTQEQKAAAYQARKANDEAARAREAAQKDTYKMQHTAPMRGDNPSGDDLSPVYGEDIYSPNALRYYGTNSSYDGKAINIIKAMKGNPDKEITIYRAVPKSITEINSSDWITTTKEYAQDHMKGEKGWHVISKKVKAKDIASDGNSIHEFGYDPALSTKDLLGDAAKKGYRQ